MEEQYLSRVKEKIQGLFELERFLACLLTFMSIFDTTNHVTHKKILHSFIPQIWALEKVQEPHRPIEQTKAENKKLREK